MQDNDRSREEGQTQLVRALLPCGRGLHIHFRIMKTFFVSDVHLGLQVGDPAGRERRFADFLQGLPEGHM